MATEGPDWGMAMSYLDRRIVRNENEFHAATKGKTIARSKFTSDRVVILFEDRTWCAAWFQLDPSCGYEYGINWNHHPGEDELVRIGIIKGDEVKEFRAAKQAEYLATNRKMLESARSEVRRLEQVVGRDAASNS